MSTFGTVMAGAVFAIGVGCIIEGILLFGRAQLLLNYAEQLLGGAAQLLAQVPGKSAPRTEAPEDVEPRRWWQRLRELAGGGPEVPLPRMDRLEAGARALQEHLEEEPVEVPVEEAEEEPAPAAVEAPQAEPEPAPGSAAAAAEPNHPSTAPREAVVDAWHREVTAVMPAVPAPDAADRALARFTFSGGHRPGSGAGGSD